MRLVLFLGVAAVLAGACSLIVDSSPSQCETDGDCYGRGGDFASSICTNGRCVGPDSGAPDAGLCTLNSECTKLLNAPGYCNLRDHICRYILSEQCQNITGSVTDDNAILIGSLNSTTGNNAAAGIARQNSAELAIAQMQQNSIAFKATPSSPPRPLVLVECNDDADDRTPAAHLINDLQVPAIIGVASSSRVLDLAQVTTDAGTLLVSAAATSPAISDLMDNGLVWRTAPSDFYQAIAVNDQLQAIETKYRADNAVPPASKVRLAIVYVQESYGTGLYGEITAHGILNGQPLSDTSNNGFVVPYSYPQSSTTPDVSMQVAAILAQDPRPNIIVGFGSAEIITQLITPLEAKWGTTAPKPVYLLTDAAERPELTTLVASDNLLRKRIRGTSPSPPTGWTNFGTFVGLYESQFTKPAPSVFGMAGTYDAIFLTGYTIAAAADRPLTGTELSKGFARLVSGKQVDVGGTTMNLGISYLANPGMFDFQGASGPLDFDLTKGEAPSYVEVWCINKGTGSGPQFVPSGRFYDLTKMSGTYDLTLCQGNASD